MREDVQGVGLPVQTVPKVLIAEPDDRIAGLLVDSLGGALGGQYRFLRVASGEEALLVAQYEKPRLVVMEVLLPRLDGLEVCRRIKYGPETAGVKVVMVTLVPGTEAMRKGLEAGADAYFVKPFSPAALEQEVRRLVSWQPGAPPLSGPV